MTFHIVDTDNFGGDYHDESFVAKDIQSKEVASFIAYSLNKQSGAAHDGPRYFKVVEDGYVLQPGFEP